jgi:hypothetical protein
MAALWLLCRSSLLMFYNWLNGGNFNWDFLDFDYWL